MPSSLLFGFDGDVTTNPAHVHPSRKEEQTSNRHDSSEVIVTGLEFCELLLVLLALVLVLLPTVVGERCKELELRGIIS